MTPELLPRLVLWGLIATVAMTTILLGSQGLGLSRLSLPFLVGTMFTANRSRATVAGFIAYVIGGWLFALLYFALFASIERASSDSCTDCSCCCVRCRCCRTCIRGLLPSTTVLRAASASSRPASWDSTTDAARRSPLCSRRRSTG